MFLVCNCLISISVFFIVDVSLHQCIFICSVKKLETLSHGNLLSKNFHVIFHTTKIGMDIYHRYALTTFESTFSFSKSHLILPAPCISENCIEIKIKLNFYLYTSLWCLERFYEDLKIKLNCYFHTSLWSSKGLKAFKAFIKPFEAKQRSVKIKI